MARFLARLYKKAQIVVHPTLRPDRCVLPSRKSHLNIFPESGCGFPVWSVLAAEQPQGVNPFIDQSLLGLPLQVRAIGLYESCQRSDFRVVYQIYALNNLGLSV